MRTPDFFAPDQRYAVTHEFLTAYKRRLLAGEKVNFAGFDQPCGRLADTGEIIGGELKPQDRVPDRSRE